MCRGSDVSDVCSMFVDDYVGCSSMLSVSQVSSAQLLLAPASSLEIEDHFKTALFPQIGASLEMLSYGLWELAGKILRVDLATIAARFPEVSEAWPCEKFRRTGGCVFSLYLPVSGVSAACPSFADDHAGYWCRRC